MPSRLSAPLLVLSASLLCACSGGDSEGVGSGDELGALALALAREEADYLARRVWLDGRLVDAQGQPVSDAELFIAGRRLPVAADGVFRVDGLAPRTVALRIAAPGQRELHTVAALQLPAGEAGLDLGTLVLDRDAADVARFFFAGDLSFGRRFMDPDESTPLGQIPPDDPQALVRTSMPREGAISVLQYLQPLIDSADFAVANFESPALDDPSTPHTTKDFVFFSLGGTLAGLVESGIDYVSLGNNHVFDYLDSGLDQTLQAVAASGLAYSGAGRDADAAHAAFATTVRGSAYSLYSATSVRGSAETPSYVAEAGKGGAAFIDDGQPFDDALAAAAASGHVIAQVHGGLEYSRAPNDNMRARYARLAAAGARLIVGHHPHTAQGFGLADGVPVAHGLGNFAFDQNRLETMFGLVLLADLRGGEALSLRGLPLYLEDFRPRLVGGEAADTVIRRIAEFSDPGVQVYPYQQQAWVNFGAPRPALTRGASVTLTIDASGVGYLDLRGLRERGESLSRMDFDAAAGAAQLGRDLMLYGDFEDWAADDGGRVAARWDLSAGSLALCARAARRGSAGACSARSAGQGIDSVLAFRNTVRIQFGGEAANRDVTVIGYLKGDGAGASVLRLRYVSDADSLLFGEEDVAVGAGGSHDWQRFAVAARFPDDSVTLTPPPDRLGNPGEPVPSRGLRISLRHAAPGDGTGLLMADDFAAVAWEDPVHSGQAIAVPHGRDFVRFRGAPGVYPLSLQFARFSPL